MTLQGIGPHGVVAAAGLAAWAKVAPKIARVAPFAVAGKDPLPGMLPEYDKFRADHNAEGVDQLKETTSEALKSLLNDRNSDEFKKFIAQHTDAEIGISGDVIAKLYGDKLPDSSDAMFGWVPDIQDKVANAIATGDDLRIPLTDWLANADKTSELMKTFGDDIRTEPGGITANEVKQSAELDAISPPAEPVPGEIPSIRAATALEPLLSVGDRKLKLERLAGAEGSRFGPEQGFHDFSLNDEKGNPVGTLNLSDTEGWERTLR
jgi:hypothetical protein